MPVNPCSVDGVSGYRWGEHGKCYTGTGAKAKASMQGRAARASGWTGNIRRSVTGIDPTRTKTLRKAFEREVLRRINYVKRMITEEVAILDGFGLKRTTNATSDITTNARFQFSSTVAQVDAFEKYIRDQLGVLASQAEDQYWQEYIRQGYEKGAGRAFSDVNQAKRANAFGSDTAMAHYEGTREEFLRSSFAAQETVEKVKLLASRTFTDLKNVEEATATSLRRVLTDGLVKGDNPWTIARELNKTVDSIGKNRSLIIARTEIIRAHAEGQLDALERMGVAEVGVQVEWSSAGDDRVCEQCQPLEGQIFKITDSHGVIPLHPQCLPGDSFVLSSSRITAASERWFDGDLIVVYTASGRKLSCTPNHPVLTNHGWIPAQHLDLGSKVVSHGGSEWKRIGDSYYEDVVPTIHDVAKSFFSSSQVTTTPVPMTPIDFHGDGSGSKVAVIGTDSSLLVKSYPPTHEGLHDSFLHGANVVKRNGLSQGHTGLGLHRLRHSPGGVIGSLNLSSSGGLVHGGPFEEFSLGGTSDVDTVIAEPTLDSPATNPQDLRELIAGLPGNVFFDEVVHVDRQFVSCHVYNLQTNLDWYIANGIITHNCRCAWIPYTESVTKGPVRG